MNERFTAWDAGPAWDDPKVRQQAADACLRGDAVLFGFDVDTDITGSVGVPAGHSAPNGRGVLIIACRGVKTPEANPDYIDLAQGS